jgi:hypothetical protein
MRDRFGNFEICLYFMQDEEHVQDAEYVQVKFIRTRAFSEAIEDDRTDLACLSSALLDNGLR